jgi:hypothetical protein
MSKSSAAVIDPRLLPALHGSAASRLASRLEDTAISPTVSKDLFRLPSYPRSIDISSTVVFLTLPRASGLCYRRNVVRALHRQRGGHYPDVAPLAERHTANVEDT